MAPSSARQLLRSVGWRVAPEMMADRARRYERGLREGLGVPALAARLVDGEHAVVTDGPFAGLRYPADAMAEIDAPMAKLTGTYEGEIQPALALAVEQGATRFVDVGSADGYYAVGMAVAHPEIAVVAFDISSSARRLCEEVARVNSVADRVEIRGRCRQADLRHLAARNAVVLCDIEGAERDLLDAATAHGMAGSVVVVEVHEFASPGTSVALVGAFAATHRADRIEVLDPAHTPPALAGWSDSERHLALDEMREPDSHWLVFRPLEG